MSEKGRCTRPPSGVVCGDGGPKNGKNDHVWFRNEPVTFVEGESNEPDGGAQHADFNSPKFLAENDQSKASYGVGDIY